jgi:adenosylmethionine-8-amino-7-oxononanoate aminotransferase
MTHVIHHRLDRGYPELVRGEGVYVFDTTGKRYLDAIGGVGVVNIGHGVQEIVDAIADQARTLAYCYGGEAVSEPQRRLAEKLDEWAPEGMGETKSLFSSGGSEANEGALKLAYQYHWERGNRSKHKIIGRWQSYHGNTIGALSMSGRTAWRRVFSHYLLGFPHIPPPYCYRCPWGKSYPACGLECAAELERVIAQEGAENVAAFIAEPVIGTSMSSVVPPPEYYPMVREICDRHDVLLIVDEVMSGVGRTGRKWGIEHWGVTPDVITTSKGLSGGYAPLGVAILAEKVWRPMADGSAAVTHSCTYGGNPLSCAVGCAVLSYIEDHDLVVRAGEVGSRLIAMLREALDDVPVVGDVRGRGLFIGIELVADRETKAPFAVDRNITLRVEEEAFQRGLIVLGGMAGMIDGAAGDHFQVLPPYTVEDEHLEFMVGTVREAVVAATSRP